jgi:hypothetical protein
MIEVILPSGSEIEAFMVTVWLISPLVGDVTTITGGLFSGNGELAVPSDELYDFS